jgi:hypothetical protein
VLVVIVAAALTLGVVRLPGSPNPPALPLGWQAPVQLTNDNNNDSVAGNGWQVTADVKGNVHVVWVQSPTGSPSNNGVFWKMWDQKGSWSASTRISPAISSQVACCYPSVATDSSGNVWFAWSATNMWGQQHVYVRRWSSTGGLGAIDSCSNDGVANRNPVVQCFRDTVHVLWLGHAAPDYPILHRAKQINAGPGQWTAIDNLTQNAVVTSPCLSVGRDNRLHAVWLSNAQVRYRSRIGGVWFPVESCSATGNVKYDPTVAVDTGGVIHVAWRMLESFGWCQQYYNYRLPSGGWLPNPIRVALVNGEQFAPRISCDFWGNVDLVWYGISGTSWEVIYTRRTPPGSFSVPTHLNLTNTTPLRPSAASCLYGNLHVVWSDTTGGASGGDEEIFYCRYKTAHDVGLLNLNPPGADVDSTFSAITPTCSTCNYGELAETYRVRLRIGAFYDQTVQVRNHTPQTKLQVQFPVFSNWPRGSYFAACSLWVVGDSWFANDTLSKRITGHVHDVRCDTLSAPPASIDSVEPAVAPKARISNRGSEDESFNVTFRISDGYFQSLPVSLAHGDSHSYSFPPWSHLQRGTWLATCSTKLAYDANHGNDVLQRQVMVRVPDVGVVEIVSPVGTVDSSDSIVPRARLRNNGSHPATFDAWFRFDSTGGIVYNQRITIVSLPVGVESLVPFPAWPHPHRISNYASRCSLFMTGDVNRSNDALGGAFIVRYFPPPQSGVWTQMADLLAGVRQKNVKDGGALAYGRENGNDTGFVFAFKGNGTGEFYRYNPITNAWVSRDTIPLRNRVSKKKLVKKGAALAMTVAGRVYATKGNNCYDFWEYTPGVGGLGAGVWVQKADVPTGSRAVREGTGLAAIRDGLSNADYLYLLKGSGTSEFYRYDVAGNSWATLNSPPTTKFKNGSCVAWDGADTIFALKGSTNEFFVYSIAGQQWQTHSMLPLNLPGSTRKKKVKDGAGLAYADRIVYALKGGGTNEFWTYQCDAQSWLADNPMQPSPMNKTVKGGGALVYDRARHALYALRGNNTREFWMYTGRALSAGRHPLSADCQPEDVQGDSTSAVRHTSISIAPNPFAGSAIIAYSLPRGDIISLRLYDVTGRLTQTLRTGYARAGISELELRASDLPKGIYLLRLEGRGLSLEQKLVVE